MGIIGVWLELRVWELLLALAAFYAIAGIIIHLLVFHSPVSDWARSFRGVVAPFFVTPILIFSLLLGFIASEVWHRNAEAVQLVRDEGDALFTLTHLIPEKDPAEKTLLGLIRAYAQSVVAEEWPRMQGGNRSAAAEAAFTSLLSAIVETPVPGVNGPSVQKARLDIAAKLHAFRGIRISLAGDRTDEIKWATLLILGLLAQLAIAAVHLEIPRPQIAALTIFTLSAVAALGLVAIQERPFAPPYKVSPEPLVEVVHEIPAP
jgi:hypothetical protein